MIHKLADGPVTLVVADVSITEGKFGMQYRFVGTDGTEVYISETAGQRGLDRLKLNTATAVGQQLTLFQVKKDGKTYTNIERAGTAVAAEAAADMSGVSSGTSLRVVGGTPTGKKTLAELEELYGQCLDIALRTLVKKCEEFSVPIDGAAVQAATATLFIAAK